ncbi:hypothetical protein AncyloWKF20_20875 [Ancylobacter sp. WKF20]|uniref:hypothetical protein n=1 Tax=Ancylobacter sp. WKF20 TaxID=3039801 RepID=UPI00243459F1|nr:hypothetical protein [Ancylobacter sp. WKF20]WGD30170.1 hypothetical protein AncyloWKF20_20875 [Ancylobacter sp. WKF20]
MGSTVLIIDTSVLCCLLDVPGKETCGSDADRWNNERVSALLEQRAGAVRVLPLATIIETGNHISQANGDRHNVAKRLSAFISSAADGESPWAAFTDQADLWGAENLKELALKWPNLAAARTSIGDATIKDVAEFYARAGYAVEIVTGDAGLKAYEPKSKPMVPRRREK